MLRNFLQEWVKYITEFFEKFCFIWCLVGLDWLKWIKFNLCLSQRTSHWKKYFNVHFKSQNYSCLLDSHPCLGYRNFCCKKISCNKSKIKAVVLMEKLKQHNLGVKFTPAYFFPCHFDSENKLHWQYSLSIRQYSLSIRQRILLM